MTLDVSISGVDTESYLSAVEFDAYASSMGWSIDLDETGKETALRRSFMAINVLYSYAGTKSVDTQSGEHPRNGAAVIDKKIKSAQSEMTYLIINGYDPFATVSSRPILSVTEKVGSISESTTYGRPAVGSETPKLVAVDALLAGFIQQPTNELLRA